MKRLLKLTSFDAPASEPLLIRRIRSSKVQSPHHEGPLEITPLWLKSAPAARPANKLVLFRTVSRPVRLAGRLTAAGMLIWVLVAGQAVQARSARVVGTWAEGTIVTSDPSRKEFTLAQPGRRELALVSWNGQTHSWNRKELTRQGKPVEPDLLQANRIVRVLVARTRNGLVAKRIILLSSLADAKEAS